MITDRRGEELRAFAEQLTGHEVTYMRGLLRESRVEKLIRKSHVAKWANISMRQLDKQIDKGEFPPSVSFGDQSKRWSVVELDRWVAEQVDKQSKDELT